MAKKKKIDEVFESLGIVESVPSDLDVTNSQEKNNVIKGYYKAYGSDGGGFMGKIIPNTTSSVSTTVYPPTQTDQWWPDKADKYSAPPKSVVVQRAENGFIVYEQTTTFMQTPMFIAKDVFELSQHLNEVFFPLVGTNVVSN